MFNINKNIQTTIGAMYSAVQICFCRCCSSESTTKCTFFETLKVHSEEVTSLLSSQFDIVTLSVGSTKKLISCHKILLGYYSSFFNGMLYGSFHEAKKSIIELPNYNETKIVVFVKWIYTGNIHNCHDWLAPEECSEVECTVGPRLWVLGDKILAPKFCNEAMKFTIAIYTDYWLNSGTAEYIYTNTLPESKLRKFTCDLIACEGPLSEGLKASFNRESWLLLLAKGGDLVKENIVTGFSNNKRGGDDPWNVNPGQYMEDDGSWTVAEWLESKPTS